MHLNDQSEEANYLQVVFFDSLDIKRHVFSEFILGLLNTPPELQRSLNEAEKELY